MYRIHSFNGVGISINPKICHWLGHAHQVGRSFFSYIILDNAQHIAHSSVIGIPQYGLFLDHMKEKTKNFMTSLESLIGNCIEVVFHPTSPSLIYYDAFGESSDTDDNFLPYGDELFDVISETVDKDYLEALNHYIRA